MFISSYLRELARPFGLCSIITHLLGPRVRQSRRSMQSDLCKGTFHNAVTASRWIGAVR